MRLTTLSLRIRLLIVSALATVLLLPLQDHHFVERIPGHRHVASLYDLPGTTPRPYDHVHMHQITHAHSHEANAPTAAAQVAGWQVDGAASGGLLAVASLLPPVQALLTVPPALPWGQPTDAPAYRGVSVTPLHPPPVPG